MADTAKNGSIVATAGRSVVDSIVRCLPRASDYAELRHSWRFDAVAGVTVGVVALPLALAFGVSSGVGAAAGLVTAVIAGLIAAIFGGSHLQVSGPTGAMVVVLAPIVESHGVASIAAVSVIAGCIVLIAGLSGIGRIVSFIPWPVVEGFTVGIAVIIGLQQIPMVMNVEKPEGHNTAVVAVESIMRAQWPTAAISVAVTAVTIGLILVIRRWGKQIPPAIVAVIVISAAAEFLHIPIDRIGELPSSLPAPVFPAISWSDLQSLLGPALAVAGLAAIESLLSARVADGMTRIEPTNPDRELFGQGLASIASGLFGGMPATGAIARTAVNTRTGARTRVSAIIHALLLLVIVYVGSALVSVIPLATLAGVLLVTAFGMVNRATSRSILRSNRGDAAAFVITALCTVVFDLIVAIEIGVVLAAFFVLRSLSRTVITRDSDEEPEAVDGRIAIFSIEGALFFGSTQHIEAIAEKVAGADVVILRLSGVRLIDASGANALSELATALERKGIRVLIKGLPEGHRKNIEGIGVFGRRATGQVLFDDLKSAKQYAYSYLEQLDSKNAEYDEPRGTKR